MSGRPPEGHAHGASAYPVQQGSTPAAPRTAEASVERTHQVEPDHRASTNQITAPIPVRSGQAMGAPGMETSPPPGNPEGASEIALLRQQVGELTNAIGGMRERHQQELDEQRLVMQYNQNAGRGRPQALPNLPPGVDPQKEFTVGDFQNFMNRVLPEMNANAAAQAVRAVWDVNLAEEREVLNAYPQASSYPEPDRTRFILDMAKRRRSNGDSQALPPPATPGHQGSAEQTQQVRPAQARVPQPEVNQPSVAQEPQTENPLEQASRLYREAEVLPANTDLERKERLRRMRAARDAMMAAQGRLDPEIEKREGFQQSA